MNGSLWKLHHVTLGPPGQARLRRASGEIPRGITAVMGPSGAGKSSLLELLVGFEVPSAGRLETAPSADATRLPVFWSPGAEGLWPELSVREHLRRVAPAGTPDAEVDRLLELFDLQGVSGRRPGELSLGEAGRTCLARALASRAEVLVLDEPLAHVSPSQRVACWKQVLGELQPGQSLVYATHQPELVFPWAEWVLCLEGGGIIHQGAASELYASPPTQDLAWALGPTNWFATPSDRGLWLTAAGRTSVRPAELRVEEAEQGPLEVLECRALVGMHEVVLRHQATGAERAVLVGQTAVPGRGVRARLTALAWLLALCLVWSGCGESAAGQGGAIPQTTSWVLPPEGMRIPAPRALHATDSEVLVLDNAGRALVYDLQGQLQRTWWMPEYSVGRPEKICQLPDGRLAVADTHYHRVMLFDATGHELSRLGGYGHEPGQFVFPVAVACDSAGNLYVGEYGGNDRVQKFDRDGGWLCSLGGPGTDPGCFQRPSGLVWRGGRVYVVDAFNNRVQVFADDGQFLEVLGDRLPSGAPELLYPYDIAFGPGDDLFIAEYGAGRVTRLSLEGQLLGRYGSTGHGTGQLQTPWGLTVDRAGQVWVADTGNRRIVRFHPDEVRP